MTFLSAAFLWGLPLLAAPVVIHLLHRRQQKVIRWGAMQFLRLSQKRQRRISRIDDWWLMLLRTAALLALVFALARPMLKAAWLGAGPRRDVLLVLDVSMSMGRVSGDGTPFERLQEQLDDVFDRLSSSDTVQVVLAAAAPLWQTTAAVAGDSSGASALREQLAALTPSDGPGDVLAAVESALAADLTERAESRLVCVISDCRAQGMPADGAIAAARLRQQLGGAAAPTVINIVDVGTPASDVENIGVESLEADRVLAGVGEAVEVRGVVKNFGTLRSERCEWQWRVDGEPWSVSCVEPLDAGQSATMSVENAFERPGTYTISGQISGSDELAADDSGTLIVEVRDKAPVLIVSAARGGETGDAAARFVMASLGRGNTETSLPQATTFFEPELIESSELERIELSRFYAVVLVDTPPLEADVVQRLAEFVEAGGGLWVALGEESDATAFNEVFGSGDGGLSPVIAGETVTDESADGAHSLLHPPAVAHPATALLGDTVRLDIRDARITRRWKLQPQQPGEKLLVLLETGRGEPVAVERFVGRGRVIVQSFPLTRSWSNLTLCKLFVPYVQEWLRYLVQPVGASHNLLINAPIVVRRPASVETRAAVLDAPLQEPVELAAEVEQDAVVYRYFGTVFPGDYTLTIAGEEPPERFHVRRDPAESDLESWSPEERAAMTAPAEIVMAEDPLDWPQDVALSPPVTPAWKWCLIALAALIGIELLSICWFAWRKHVIARVPSLTAT